MDAMDQLDKAVEITVSDTGGGIPTDRFPRLFDAFFTTKEQGLGLGLAIARTIVDGHGGEIWPKTTPHKATPHAGLRAT